MNVEERIERIFGLTKKNASPNTFSIKEENELLVMKIRVNRTKYANLLSSYSEVLKEYFKDYRLHVLTRTKEHRGLRNIYAILFQNSKKSIMSEMKTFTPNYLARKDDVNILITQDDDSLKAYELPIISDDHFSFRGYRYKIANEIFLK